ncbi:hypothetical protein [Fulvimonas soli]|uniref:Late embryogenesis abundant protein n=1 Tax=Fulvimonas soli TaxID=155197 RepID=A0A316HSU1_9GAMM|nr:hypothetical protein [Fulvimonas soli]PWK84326.1 hypothetical protein C7456_1114 [Fulvimonas soli]TNY25656.1 hypothetical protein BV497_12810 [Fulvimonas soli]
MRLLRWIIPTLLCLGLIACGPPRKSVFPPSLSVQQLQVRPDGRWHLAVRIQNNSYAGMDFSAIEGELQVAQLVPVRLHARFDLDIPALAGDVLELDVLPTPEMSAALRAIDAKGSAGSLAYSVSGTATATPEKEDKPRDFPFHGNDWLSPVPGIADTYR